MFPHFFSLTWCSSDYLGVNLRYPGIRGKGVEKDMYINDLLKQAMGQSTYTVKYYKLSINQQHKDLYLNPVYKISVLSHWGQSKQFLPNAPSFQEFETGREGGGGGVYLCV